MAGNTATQGAGVMGINAAAIGVVNSIVHRNTSEALRANSGATFNVTYSNIQGGYAGAGNVMGNPAFVDPDNGDYHLLSTSPCIDAADGDAAPNLDLEGNPRQDLPGSDLGRGNPSYVDMGAYEFLP